MRQTHDIYPVPCQHWINVSGWLLGHLHSPGVLSVLLGDVTSLLPVTDSVVGGPPFLSMSICVVAPKITHRLSGMLNNQATYTIYHV